jgi:hypothetical protein
MQKITKNEYVELLRNNKFCRIGYDNNIDKIKPIINTRNLTSENLKDCEFFTSEIHATQIIHKKTNHNDCYESLAGKNAYYKYQLNDILYLLHAYFENNEIYNVAIKGIIKS